MNMAFQVLAYILLFCLYSPSQIAQAHPPLGYLNQLSGVKKGDSVNGLYNLKNHLSYLGYLNHNTHSQSDANTFDDSLETALTKYQEFYHLNITGFLDADTITQMRQPRCGMPDFLSPDTTISRYSFYPNHPKWHKKNLTYAFEWNVYNEAKRSLENALKEWASATPFRFHYVKKFDQADIKFSFVSGDHGDGYPFMGPSTGVAHAFAPTDGRIHFNLHQNWSWVVKRNFIDMQTVALHELGHVLGLRHSTVFKAIMYPEVLPGRRKGLHRDDVDGIKALYNFKGK